MKKHGFLFVLLAGLSLFILGSCIINVDRDDDEGNGEVISKERCASKEFDTVVLKGIVDVKFYTEKRYKGEDYAVVVTTDSNLQDAVSIDIYDKCLYINGKERSNCKPTKLEIEVYLPYLKCVKYE